MLQHFIILIAVLATSSLRIGRNKQYSLVLSLLIIFIFLSIRFDYGTDYYNYYDLFYINDEYLVESGELLFNYFFKLFNNYTAFIVCHTGIICFSLYYFIKNNIPQKYYALFFLIFMLHPGMVYCMITAFRSALAACLFLFFAYQYYIKRRNNILFVLGIIACSLIHTSALVFIFIPLWDKIISKVNSRYILIIFSIIIILGYTLGNQLTAFLTQEFELFSKYDKYSENGYFENNSFGIIVLRIFYLVPLFFVIKNFKKTTSPQLFRTYVLTLLYFLILFGGLDFQNRYTVILYPFVIATFSQTLQNIKKPFHKFIFYFFWLFIVFYMNYIMYTILANDLSIQGNFLFYKTIFSLDTLP